MSELGERARRRVELLHRIDEAKHRDPVVTLEEHDVAGQEQACPWIDLDGFERERWIAGTEDPIPTEISPQLRLEGLLEIDLRDNAKAFGLERSRKAFDRRI